MPLLDVIAADVAAASTAAAATITADLLSNITNCRRRSSATLAVARQSGAGLVPLTMASTTSSRLTRVATKANSDPGLPVMLAGELPMLTRRVDEIVCRELLVLQSRVLTHWQSDSTLRVKLAS